jgi:hypothetical protein
MHIGLFCRSRPLDRLFSLSLPRIMTNRTARLIFVLNIAILIGVAVVVLKLP